MKWRWVDPATVYAVHDIQLKRTADSLGGMVDMHDRSPVAVSAEDARRWLDPALTPEEAEHLARPATLDAGLCEWCPVSHALNAGAEGPEMGKPWSWLNS